MGAGGGKAAFDALIVGAGFAGLYMLHRLRTSGLSVRVLEAGDGIGGTWYWNRYPGARCDIESTQYSYQFSPELEQDWEWSERYAAQPELLAYAGHVADRFELHPHIQLSTRVTGAHFDEATNHWHLITERGDRFSAPICIMATGCLSVPAKPTIPGMETFAGSMYHTGLWPHADVDFAGKRVAIIGTGSSAIQSIPNIARQAAQLTVFQRSAAYSVPARNILLSGAVKDGIKAVYRQLRARAKLNPTGVLFDSSPEKALETAPELRQREYERRWARGGLTFLGAYADLLTDEAANRTAADFVAAKIRSIVKSPATAEILVPKGPIGGKRLCVDIGYYESFNRANVTLVDVSATPIERIIETGVRVQARDYRQDAIVFATGFDAMTGALDRIAIRGRAGHALKERWSSGPRTYLGLTAAGFPNLFMITGPGSPSVLTNMLPSIEQNVDWIADCVGYMRENAIASIEASQTAEDEWVAHVADAAAGSLRNATNSWYLGANVPGKPRVFMPYAGGFPRYAAKCEEVARDGYRGFIATPSSEIAKAGAASA